MITATTKDKRPDKPHYAIVELRSLSHDDGYGGTTSTEYNLYHYTYDKAEWLDEIEKLEHPKYTYDRTSYFAMQVDKIAKVTTKVIVEHENVIDC